MKIHGTQLKLCWEEVYCTKCLYYKREKVSNNLSHLNLEKEQNKSKANEENNKNSRDRWNWKQEKWGEKISEIAGSLRK